MTLLEQIFRNPCRVPVNLLPPVLPVPARLLLQNFWSNQDSIVACRAPQTAGRVAQSRACIGRCPQMMRRHGHLISCWFLPIPLASQSGAQSSTTRYAIISAQLCTWHPLCEGTGIVPLYKLPVLPKYQQSACQSATESHTVYTSCCWPSLLTVVHGLPHDACPAGKGHSTSLLDLLHRVDASFS